MKRICYMLNMYLVVPNHPFPSILGNMVDPEDFTLEKIETQDLSFEINTLSDTLQQNASYTGDSSESPQVNAVVVDNKFKPEFK